MRETVYWFVCDLGKFFKSPSFALKILNFESTAGGHLNFTPTIKII